MGTATGTDAGIKAESNKTGLYDQKIAPSVVWLDDIFVTKSNSDSATVITGWQVKVALTPSYFQAKNSFAQ
jgi:hypothetical protein